MSVVRSSRNDDFGLCARHRRSHLDGFRPDQRPFPTSVVLPSSLLIAGEILTSRIRSIDTPARPIRYAGLAAEAAITPPLERGRTLSAFNLPLAGRANQPREDHEGSWSRGQPQRILRCAIVWNTPPLNSPASAAADAVGSTSRPAM
jgi:hypothetical protein